MESEDKDYLNLKFEKPVTDFLKKDGKTIITITLFRNYTVFYRGVEGLIPVLQEIENIDGYKHPYLHDE
jgi:hypothetical protein